MKNILAAAFVIILLQFTVQSQFNSGSTGVDGALDLATASFCQENGNCEVQLPESGILNYTTVNVPAGKVLIFKRNSRNSPAIILAQGNVTISGEVNVSAPCTIPGVSCTGHTPSASSTQTPGVGGFSGGAPNRDGLGPGGGIAAGDINGRWAGPLNLIPIVVGSGGAGFTCGFPYFDCLGGGGGGAIVIASTTSIAISGRIKSIGSVHGSGGAIRIITNTLNIAGQLLATGSYNGIIRLESNSLTFTGTTNPIATSAPVNPSIISNNAPQLTIASVGGYAVRSYSGSRFDLVDLLLPNQLPDPINVVVSANNIPVGTEVRVGFVSGSPNGTSTPCTLSGSFANSSCTATISSLNRTGGTYLLATAMFAPPASAAQYNPKGENWVAKIRLETSLGGKPIYVFLRDDGKEIDPKNLHPQFLQQFGG